MSAEVLPRHIAEALAELGRDRVLEAQAYLDAWRSLKRSGVPAHAIRHFLDRQRKPSPSMAAVERWGGRHGALFLLGNRGCGKGHAAVSWLHELHKQGRPGRWMVCANWLRLSFDAQRAELDLAASASALVVDDLGAGGSSDSDDGRKKITGLLLERFERDQPTLIALNGTHESVLKWLDPRLLSRLEVSGDLVDVTGENLRTAELDDINRPDCPCETRRSGRVCGHGTAWRDNHELVELMGCEVVHRPTGEHDDGPTRKVWRTGLQLVLGPSNRRNLQASELLGLSREVVRERARELAANDKTPSLRNELEQALLRMANGTGERDERLGDITQLAEREEARVRARMRSTGESHEQSVRALEFEIVRERELAAGRRADNIARSKAMREVLANRRYASGRPWNDEDPGHTGRKTMASKPPAWTQDRNKMKRFGFAVKPGTEGFDVTYKGDVRIRGIADTETAWQQAAHLAGCGW